VVGIVVVMLCVACTREGSARSDIHASGTPSPTELLRGLHAVGISCTMIAPLSPPLGATAEALCDPGSQGLPHPIAIDVSKPMGGDSEWINYLRGIPSFRGVTVIIVGRKWAVLLSGRHFDNRSTLRGLARLEGGRVAYLSSDPGVTRCC
jgi:hypothetical protein